MGESPSQYTVQKLGTTHIPVIRNTDSTVVGSVFPVSNSQYIVQTLGTEYIFTIGNIINPVIGSMFTVDNYLTKVVRIPTPNYSIIQRDNYYDTIVPINLN